MNHLTRRDRQQAIQFKHIHEDLDDEAASHIEDLLAAAQKRDHERPLYTETARPENRTQQGGYS